ncbi:uncharacterized protein LOC123296058 [Chrysoperla carnea]|uniref:uncharacterized protein LOC123296058 n=1 Tax=Chrysoperla carnea TaxID=189513 RepID=UPI001D05D865|nr:uncharacterized protein LOC123296058 [Chrysoperla carnea]
MPIVTRSGEIINSADQLEEHLQMLNIQLQEKVSALKYECQELQEQIDEYLKRREIIKKEISDRIDDKTIHPMEKSDEDNIVTEADLTYEEMQKWINEFKNKYNLSLINLESESNQDKDNELIHLQRNDEGVNKAESYKSYIRVCNSINCDYKMAPSSLDLDFLKNESKSTVMREVAL